MALLRRAVLGKRSTSLLSSSAGPVTTISSFLVPFLHQTRTTQQIRNASLLGSLKNVKSSYSKRIRRGRGPSSGKGKTSGRGHKGQKQHGKVPAGFNGGQTPLRVQKPPRGGGVNVFAEDITPLNLDKLQLWIDQGRIDARAPITLRELHSSGCSGTIKDGLKLLANNAHAFHTRIHITVSRASAAAIAAVESAGGTIQTRFYTRDSIRRVLRGDSHPTLSRLSLPPPPSSSEDPSAEPSRPAAAAAATPPANAFRYRLPDPTSRKDFEYYRDPAHRGYLSHTVGVGEGPSLFFRTPSQVAPRRAAGREKRRGREGEGGSENRLW